MLREKPADSITNNKFWDWRFKFYYVKKAYLSRLVAGGFSVIQADTDTVWSHDPFPALRTIPRYCTAHAPQRVLPKPARSYTPVQK